MADVLVVAVAVSPVDNDDCAARFSCAAVKEEEGEPGKEGPSLRVSSVATPFKSLSFSSSSKRLAADF